ncbi:hypothetical protein MARCHEWKA_00260 [Brevundimonas phage vB_BpoS-Marchewka]|uniref:Uncharacterized protein n=1 Tax=Brevundimonas phage vB_BpoS-Marchewka TaxID=2948604 RepID=A0A9E7N563_9CAUD|nr:hypothetical protein MARCHEWKA_00260 [Brevundimonas phage vB_BpoS-Marchewka]UTC29537.1 hypothetical protein BAMBUS_04740 [Brevundimonas phage vB_BpoS-Bambus]
MAHNTTRAQRMMTLTVAELIGVYLSGSLASAAAAAELRRRNVPLPSKIRTGRRPRLVEVIYGPVPYPPLHETLKRRAG